MKTYIISPMSHSYLTQEKKYEVLCEHDEQVYLIEDDDGDMLNVNPMGSAHTRGLAWEIVMEEETHE